VGGPPTRDIVARHREAGASSSCAVGVLSPSAADRGQTIRNVPVLAHRTIRDVIRDYDGLARPITRV